MHKLFGISLGVGLFLFGITPSSTNFMLRSYDIGSGGIGSSSSTSYRLNGDTGEQSGTLQSSTTYGVVSGVNTTMNASVPVAPTLTNPSNYYDRLKLILNPGTSPSDTKYLIAISSNNFVTTNYVQADHSVAGSQVIANYQTYTSWGGSSGFLILGLTPSTSYKVKVKALQGNFSGSAFGPTAGASTVATSLSMGLSTTLNPTPPFPVGFPSLTAGSVVAGSADAIIALTSNANNGGTVYTRSANAGLLSVQAGNTITSATTNLSSATSGYGAIVIANSQVSGGPFTALGPFNGSANNIGALTTTLQPILTSVGPISGGSGTVRFMAKSSTITPSASDYSDTVTFVIAMNF
ncbi:MAG: hypothetical protein ABI220_04415 [Candidatus Saccharimonadales bacterium]